MPSYRELAPPAALRELVECAWSATSASDAAPHRQRVLPDGCMDLLVRGGELVVAGPDTVAFAAVQGPGQVVAGLRFRPGAAPGLLGVPASALRDQRVPLGEVWPALACRAGSLLDRGLPAPLALVRAAVAALPEVAEPDPGLRRAAALLAAGAEVAATADALGWTTRSLHRRADTAFGYGPATLRRILRFRRAMRMAWRGVPAAAVATDAGYADQAHLSREVRALAGAPLGQLVAGSGANRSTTVPSGSRTSA